MLCSVTLRYVTLREVMLLSGFWLSKLGRSSEDGRSAVCSSAGSGRRCWYCLRDDRFFEMRIFLLFFLAEDIVVIFRGQRLQQRFGCVIERRREGRRSISVGGGSPRQAADFVSPQTQKTGGVSLSPTPVCAARFAGRVSALRTCSSLRTRSETLPAAKPLGLNTAACHMIQPLSAVRTKFSQDVYMWGPKLVVWRDLCLCVRD